MLDFTYLGLIARITITLFIGIPALWVACKALKDLLLRHTSHHISILVSNSTLYIGYIFLSISFLHDLGFNLSALLGAAGIIGVAVGFAAQTSISNIISGLFLVLEGSCAIDDQIELHNLTGTIESIDLLSVKIRTEDNMFVRIPNEFFIKKSVINKTYYATRVITFKIAAPIEYNVHTIKEKIKDIISTNTLFLSTPAPKIHLFEIVTSYVTGTEQLSYITNELKVEIWIAKGTANSARDAFVASIQRYFSQEHIKATITRL